MVENLREKDDALKEKNKRGNTPLHTAAALGNARMCHCIASKYPNLIAEINEKNETPCHLAAQFGHKDAFLCLYFCYKGNHSDIRSRDASGNTILHAAIGGEHFDLAFQIICKYPELVNAVNINGYSPLHVLATRTSAFKSGSRLGLFDGILYRYLVEMYHNHKNKKSISIIDEENPQGPTKTTQGIDEENPQWTIETTHESNNSNGVVKGSSDTGSGTSPKAKEDKEDESSSAKEHREHYLPANYATFIQFFKFVMKFLLVILGLGFSRIKKITRKKQRHRWASQVMNELIEKASMYKYPGGKTGRGKSEMTEDLPSNVSQMMSSSHPDTDIGNGKNSSVKTLNKQGECHNKTDSSKKKGKVEKFLGEYHITGNVDSKTSKHAVEMKFEKKVASKSTKSQTSSPILIAEVKDLHCRCNGNSNGTSLSRNHWQNIFLFITTTNVKPQNRSSQNHTKPLSKMAVNGSPKPRNHAAALIATVAFSTAATIPGGVTQDTGKPVLRDEPAFGVFAISSLVALCFSITALVFFLAILTSRFEEKDFVMKLPRKLILGLTSLFCSPFVQGISLNSEIN
ncbi:hypothetical protein CRYUN_Cryun40dG0060500 [Craigia yunnanensis]